MWCYLLSNHTTLGRVQKSIGQEAITKQRTNKTSQQKTRGGRFCFIQGDQVGLWVAPPIGQPPLTRIWKLKHLHTLCKKTLFFSLSWNQTIFFLVLGQFKLPKSFIYCNKCQNDERRILGGTHFHYFTQSQRFTCKKITVPLNNLRKPRWWCLVFGRFW